MGTQAVAVTKKTRKVKELKFNRFKLNESQRTVLNDSLAQFITNMESELEAISDKAPRILASVKSEIAEANSLREKLLNAEYVSYSEKIVKVAVATS